MNAADMTDEQLAQLTQVPLVDFVNEAINGLYAEEHGVTYRFEERDLRYSYYSSSNGDEMMTAVLAGDWASARRIAVADAARSLYSEEQGRRSYAEQEQRRRKAERAEQDRKDSYLTTHTAHPWMGPRTTCFVRRSDQLGGGQCQKRGDFVVIVDKPSTRYPDTALGVSVECTVHATRIPKYGNWPYYVGTAERQSFAADPDNARWLKEVKASVEPIG